MNEKKIVEKYTKLLSKHGDNFKSLDWGSEESQIRRFDVFMRIGDIRHKKILDYGCGTASFKDYLTIRKIQCDYTGIDITPAMVDFCRKKYPSENFINGDYSILEKNKYDYIFASGIFYLRQKDGYDFLKKYISEFYDHCKLGLAVNFLSDQISDSREEDEFYASAEEVLQIARKISDRYSLHHDYAKNDFTLFILKNTL